MKLIQYLGKFVPPLTVQQAQEIAAEAERIIRAGLKRRLRLLRVLVKVDGIIDLQGVSR